jgi:tripartite-type tricarboxylate transporter receptor subunit TctC
MQRFTIVLLTAVLPLLAGTAHSQSWPAKPVRVVVANSPGAGTDIAARVFTGSLSQRVSQSVVVENRPGADGYIAAETVARSAPDGYTLFFASQSFFGIDPHIKKSMPVDPVRDFTPIAVMCDDTGASGLYAHPSMPFTSIPEMVAHAKANPGKLSVATVVPLFSMMNAWIGKRGGIEILDVKYKSSAQATQDVIAGRVPLLLQSFGTMEQHVKSGKVRVLALSRAVDDYPQFPTFASVFPGFKQPSYMVLMGPAGMDAELTRRINRAAAAVVEDAKFNQDLRKLRWRNLGGARTPEGTAQFLRQARADWGEFIRETGLRPQ